VSARGSAVQCASHGAGLPSVAQGAGRDTGWCTGGRRASARGRAAQCAGLHVFVLFCENSITAGKWVFEPAAVMPFLTRCDGVLCTSVCSLFAGFGRHCE
jgi:hypothetical protein